MLLESWFCLLGPDEQISTATANNIVAEAENHAHTGVIDARDRSRPFDGLACES